MAVIKMLSRNFALKFFYNVQTFHVYIITYYLLFQFLVIRFSFEKKLTYHDKN